MAEMNLQHEGEAENQDEVPALAIFDAVGDTKRIKDPVLDLLITGNSDLRGTVSRLLSAIYGREALDSHLNRKYEEDCQCHIS